MSFKLSFLKLIAIAVFFTSCKGDTDAYPKLLAEELTTSNAFLKTQIDNQDLYIISKCYNRANLQPGYDSLDAIKLEIRNVQQQYSMHLKDSIEISNFKNQIESKSKQHFEFRSLKIKSGISDSLYLKIVKQDLLKAVFKINEKYIAKHCNNYP